MRRRSYLNVILTVNAALLAGLLWTQVADRPVFAGSAAASSDTGSGPPIVPNAAEQRQKMIDELRTLRAAIDAQSKALSTGTLKVQVTNFGELKLDQKD